MTIDDNRKIDRRLTLKWLMATLGTAPVLAACNGIPDILPKSQLLGVPKPITGTTYGSDPAMTEPTISWELTMTDAQLDLVSALTDLVVPAIDEMPSGSALELPAFVNEWVSSPYEKTRRDRERFFELFEWLERRAVETGNASYAAAPKKQQRLILDRIAWSGEVGVMLWDMARAYRRFRRITVSAFFASEPGSHWLGYRGNTPSDGDYEGPTPEALEHLQDVLAKLNLKMPEGL